MAALPKTLNASIDALWRKKEKLDAANKVVSGIKKEYEELENHIFEQFNEQGNLEGARGKLAQVSISRSVQPQAKDWDAVWKYITRTKSFDLLQKRLSVTACRERWDDKKNIPGVEQFTKVSLSLRKVK